MNFTSPEELWSIAVLLFSRTSCKEYLLVKLKLITIPAYSPGLRAEVMASCLTEAEVWCHPYRTENQKVDN